MSAHAPFNERRIYGERVAGGNRGLFVCFAVGCANEGSGRELIGCMRVIPKMEQVHKRARKLEKIALHRSQRSAITEFEGKVDRLTKLGRE